MLHSDTKNKVNEKIIVNGPKPIIWIPFVSPAIHLVTANK